ncbi:glycosyl hydrolase family 95 catalytic domain-containing protein [Formosa sp. PL04]|uniref:glycosyl hydrolase family 95 catalytic domain-containing protein n=1 Tax=Formosa sp. PL04 TaxID=3081755 RepID=UPI002981524D|nr:glycoside hydrolase N-terminal domain-containing protein [Formosa sp. PL04]MDW5290125.1 glycoside hydrolase N-terminal domain-containing protein [Formosa sp. PL04]
MTLIKSKIFKAKISKRAMAQLFVLLILFSCNNNTNSEQLSDIEKINKTYRRGMTMITPAEQWREGLPSGNGTIGALVYGSISEERVLFNHNELWYGGKIEDVPDVSAELPTVRKLMLEGKYLEANNYYTKKLRDKGFSAKNAIYHPAFDLLLTTESEYMFEDYSRTLDFETGEIEVKWTDGDNQFSRRLFVSIPDNVSVMSIKADNKNVVSGEVTLDIHDINDAIAQNGVSFDPGFRYESFAKDGYVEFHSTGTDGGEFGGVLRVIVKNGKQESLNQTVSSKRKSEGYKANESGVIAFNSADEVVLIVGYFANETSTIAISRLKKELAEMTSDYEVLFNKHKPLHSEKFNRVNVNLNLDGPHDTPNEILLLDAYKNSPSNELTQKLFDYGRYLLISSSRTGGYPANLQGLWNGDYSPPWSSLYGINENLQMTYWQGLPGDLKESMMAFYDYFDAHLDDFRYNAKQLWGTEGIYIPPFMSPDSGKLRHSAPHVVNWTDAAGWLASFYYDYYLFTGDEDFLRNRAIPFMKEVALFYEGFIVKGADGKNMFFPSQSPENQPANMDVINPITGRTEGIKVQINSTIAVAISKEVLTNLITSCEFLDVEEEAVKRWKILLADMPEYQINEDGALKEWIHPDFEDNYEHRHQSHIYPLFPGHEITEESNPELYDASKVAIEKRLRIGLKSQTGWSLAHMANVYARLGDGDKAEEALNILMRSCLGKNFFTYHNDWRKMGVTLDFTWGRTAPFQMDANFGITAAITEMLCGSTNNMLRILPALPADWDQGAFQNLLTRVGVRTSVAWDKDKKYITILLHAERNTSFDLNLPDKVSQIESNQLDILKESKYGDDYRFINLQKGQEINIKLKLK